MVFSWISLASIACYGEMSQFHSMQLQAQLEWWCLSVLYYVPCQMPFGMLSRQLGGWTESSAFPYILSQSTIGCDHRLPNSSTTFTPVVFADFYGLSGRIKFRTQKSWRACIPSIYTLLQKAQLRWAAHLVRMSQIVGCQNRYFMANSPRENTQLEVRKRDTRTAWRCLSNTLAYVTIRGKDLPRTTLPGEQGLPVELTVQRQESARWLDEAEKKHAARKARAGSTFALGSEHTCPTCGKVCRARIGLLSHLRTHRPLSTSNWIRVVIIFDYEGRTSLCTTAAVCWSYCTYFQLSFSWRVSLHHLHAMHRCGLLLQFSVVCLSVCLSVCWSHGCVMPKWLNWSRCSLELTVIGQRNHVLDGGRHPTWEWAILGVVQPIDKYWESLLW